MTDLKNNTQTTSPLQQWLPLAVVMVLVVYMGMNIARAGGTDDLARFDFDTLGEVPVSENGRVKPFDTVARSALLQVSGRQTLSDEMLLPGEGKDDKEAVVWLAEVMATRAEGFNRKVIRIDDPQVLAQIGKTPDDGKFYSYLEVMGEIGEDGRPSRYREMIALRQHAEAVPKDDRTGFQKHIIELTSKVFIIDRLRNLVRPYVVPPQGPDDDWEPIREIVSVGGAQTQVFSEAPAAKTWMRMLTGLAQDDPAAFNQALKEHLKLVDKHVPEVTFKATFERGFNRFEPFVKGIAFYIFAGVLGLVTLLLQPLMSKGWHRTLWRVGLWVLVMTFVLHTAALGVRIWLQGRPPVTNLYSSAVFIGWALVGGAIVLERITKLSVATLAACAGGVGTLFIAQSLAKDGDTMGVMQAVLDSNFWLGTHVVTITLGYSATFLAGFLAILYIILGLTTTLLDRRKARMMAGMVYATVCFALLLSFVGTVLGGIWADQSWGRFWGWDPKENGAVLIVIMNAIILHARWGHLVKERGMMVLAVGGNVITAWSWFGTNLLGVGLHSYGFMDGAMKALVVFAASQMLIMAAALMFPTNMWRSFRKQERSIEPGPAPTPKNPGAKPKRKPRGQGPGGKRPATAGG